MKPFMPGQYAEVWSFERSGITWHTVIVRGPGIEGGDIVAYTKEPDLAQLFVDALNQARFCGPLTVSEFEYVRTRVDKLVVNEKTLRTVETLIKDFRKHYQELKEMARRYPVEATFENERFVFSSGKEFEALVGAVEAKVAAYRELERQIAARARPPSPTLLQQVLLEDEGTEA